MTVLLTGGNGFIGKNLLSRLSRMPAVAVARYGHEDAPDLLDGVAGSCDCVIHLAGVNRPASPGEYERGNPGFTAALIETLEKHRNACPVIFASSIQAAAENPYGLSKKMCEALLLEYGERTGAPVLIYRLPNVFGKWCRPFYNSAVATFCHQISRGLPVRVEDRDARVVLAYIDDVVEELLRAMSGVASRYGGLCTVPVVYEKTLGEIVGLLYGFRACRETLGVPDQGDDFSRKLYSTYQSHVPADALNYPLETAADDRGCFAEIIRTPDRGQLSVTVTKPGMTRGRHWHQSKNERFIAVAGEGRITLSSLDGAGSTVYDVSGARPEVVEIPPGYTHAIENTGTGDLVTVIWSNEPFDPGRPDTYDA